MLGTIGPAFALFFESMQLDQQWHYAVDNGIEMVYHSFVPHISLSYQVLPNWNYESIEPPNFMLALTEEVVSRFERCYIN